MLRLYRILAVALGVLAAVLLSEVGLRLRSHLRPSREPTLAFHKLARYRPPPFEGDCGRGRPQAKQRQIIRPSSNPDQVYELEGELDTCFQGARIEINAHGLRAEPLNDGPKPAGLHRILLLGDSHAFGWGVPFRDSVGERLEAELEAAVPGSRVQVLNAAVPGYNTFQEVARLAPLMPLEPDCVLLLFVGNDLGLPHFLLKPEKPPGVSLLVDLVRKATGSKRWFSFADATLSRFVSETDLERVPEEYRHMVGVDGYRRALRTIAETAGAEDVPVVNVADYNGVALDAAEISRFQESLGVTHLPMPWLEGRKIRLSRTDPHLNPEGHALLAHRLALQLIERAVCLPDRPASR